ncbi:transporter substrate-binding domain-containing protein [Photobacterium alginatilyticum]|uniref:transporter substrate-binding domain-containing protein n=1 Tax=Photobacterium alginatilyticum TaxID=1775171 RepID=UPI0040693245
MIRPLFLYLLLLPTLAFSQPDDNKPLLRVGYPAFDWAPFTFVSQKGHVSGLLPSIVHELADASGYKTETRLYPTFSDVMKAFNNNEVDILVGVSSTYERQQLMAFSKPLVVIPMAAIAREQEFQSVRQLNGKLVAVEQGFAIGQQLTRLTEYKPQVVSFPTSEQALTAVIHDTANAYLGNAITLDVMRNHHSTADQLKINILEDIPYERLYIASHKRQKPLVDALSNALGKIPQHRLNAIFDTWLTKSQQQYLSHQNYLNFNEQEARWLEGRTTIKVAYHPDDFPYQFTDQDGLMSGMSADVLSLLAKKLNISLVPIASSSIQEISAMLDAGRIDAIAAVTCTPERLQVFNCTQPFSEEKWVMVTPVTNQRDFIGSKAKVGVVADRYGEVLTKQLYGSNPITLFDSNEALLKAVLEHKIDSAIISLSSASSLLQGKYLGRLRVLASKLDGQGRPIGIAMAKDNNLLRDILNKAMSAVPPTKFTDIKNKWNTVTLKSGVPANKIVLWSVTIMGLVAIPLCSFIYWNRKLSKEIRQRKNAEQKLTYLTNNFDGVLLQHLQRSEDPADIELLFVSDSIEVLTGLPASTLHDQPEQIIQLLRQRNDKTWLFREIRSAVARGHWKIELQLQSAGSSKRWIEIRSQIIPLEQGWQWNTVMIDISHMKQQQRELENARRQAESATEAKSRFLAMMSHEIRTPISGILSLLELLAPHTEHRDTTRDLHKNLTQSARNLLNIVNDVLDFSKIEAGKLTLNATESQLTKQINTLVQPHVVHAGQKGLRFSLWIDPSLASTLLIDELRLKQILNNLLNNATKFTDQGEISLYLDVIDQTTQQQTLRFMVKDSGIGISRQNIRKLFQPFEQADLSSERRFSGTGLGLSICRQLVHLMGGEITIHSQLGLGSTFSFQFTASVIEPAPILHMQRRCGLVDTMLSKHNVLPQYLNYWGNDTVSLDIIDKSDLVAACHSQQLDLVIATKSWLAQQHLTPEWAQQNLTGIQLLTITDNTMLSPESGALGWQISAFPLLPDHLLHVLQHPVKAVTVHERSTLPETKAITREQAIARKQLILVAEDHLINQQIIFQQLQQLGYYADIVGNGRLALDALEKQSYYLVLTDCHMPELDGHGLLKAIRQQGSPVCQKHVSGHLPVVALTANTTSGLQKDSETYRFDAYLLKPVAMEQLSATLLQWLSPVLPDGNWHDPMPAQTLTDQALEEQALEEEDIWDLGTFTDTFFDTETCSGTGDTPDNEDDTLAIQHTHSCGHSAAINLSALENLFGETAVCIDFLQQYLESCLNDFAELSEASVAHDADNLKQISHRMKGAARMMEFGDMAATCEKVEQLADCRHGDTEGAEINCGAHLDTISQLITRLQHQVEQLRSA